MAKVRVAVDSSGLTTATTAYTDGDILGAELTFANAVGASGGYSYLVGAILGASGDVTGAVDLFLFDQTTTFGSDNGAPSISDADSDNIVGVIRFPPGIDLGGVRVASVDSITVPIKCAVTSLFGRLVTRSGHTFFAAATDLRVTLFFEKE